MFCSCKGPDQTALIHTLFCVFVFLMVDNGLSFMTVQKLKFQM